MNDNMINKSFIIPITQNESLHIKNKNLYKSSVINNKNLPLLKHIFYIFVEVLHTPLNEKTLEMILVP